MRCSLYLTTGHNKSTCKASAEEIAEKQVVAAEAKKAHIEALKAHVARNKKATSQKKKNGGHSAQSGQRGRHSGQSVATGQSAEPKKKGRPPKIENIKVLLPPPPLPPPGLGVFISSIDGHTYMLTLNGVIKVSNSQA
ncbi:hypothetical protein POM88_028530 [Heracleum sosnowskyi]|uniref:Uncharacterized protein n=1 Tax=Heracleum sosnowskyi TaxID=360622 RepID=A0AAD8HS04_9APIA|nr:hypothetical protein POM88_028530 [Heracleum sosnowskyi]